MIRTAIAEAAGATAHRKQVAALARSRASLAGVAPVGNAASFRTRSAAARAPVAASPAGHATTSLPAAVECAAQVRYHNMTPGCMHHAAHVALVSCNSMLPRIFRERVCHTNVPGMHQPAPCCYLDAHFCLLACRPLLRPEWPHGPTHLQALHGMYHRQQQQPGRHL